MSWSDRIFPRSSLAPVLGQQTVPPDGWSEVLKRIWPHVRGGRLGGDTIVTPSDLIKAAAKLGLTPQQVEDNVFGIASPPSAQNASDQAQPACLFTLCLAAPNHLQGAGDPAKLLLSRLRLNFVPASKLRNVHLYVGDQTTIVVAFKENGEFVMFEDETNMFPSDKLVAAFHLLLKAS